MTVAERLEAMDDVRDSLTTLGAATLTDLVDHTGRPPGTVEGALARLVQIGQAERVEFVHPRRWRAGGAA